MHHRKRNLSLHATAFGHRLLARQSSTFQKHGRLLRLRNMSAIPQAGKRLKCDLAWPLESIGSVENVSPIPLLIAVGLSCGFQRSAKASWGLCGSSSSFLYMKPCQTLYPNPGAEELLFLCVATPGATAARVYIGLKSCLVCF